MSQPTPLPSPSVSSQEDIDSKSLSQAPIGVAEPPRKKTWKGAIWDTFDYPAAERKLLFKVDASILIFASLGYVLKNLDQTNINSAFLSGMKEELGMHGNELVTATSIWTVGYVIGQVPSNLILTRVSPHIVIPALELGWGIATLATYAVKDVKSLYALRFLVGLFESGFYPGMHFILGSWYKPNELAKRSTIFWVSGSLGDMFSGFLQAAAYRNLNGVHGLSGWRWLFIIDAVITIPIALLGFFFLPGLPWNAKPSFLLTADDIELSKSRMKSIGRKESEPWTRAKARRIFSNWHVWVLPFIYVLWNNGIIQQPMGYWLKSFNGPNPPVPGRSYTVPEINQLPLPGTAIFIISALSWAWISDGPLKGRRWPFIYLGAIITITVAMIMRSMPLYTNIKGHFVIYYLHKVGTGAGPLILNWISEITGGDTEARAITVALGNDLAYVVQAVAPNFVWKTTDFPKASKGLLYISMLNVLLIAWVTLVLYLLRRDYKRGVRLPSETASEAEAAKLEEESAVGSVPVEVEREGEIVESKKTSRWFQ